MKTFSCRKVCVIALCACALSSFTSCGAASADDDIDIVHDPCIPLSIAAPTATTAQVESIEFAVELWNRQGTTISLVDADHEPFDVAIEFEDAAPMFKGIYLDEVGDVVINSRLADHDERTVVVAHELGHAFGLEHTGSVDEQSLMSSGNIDVPPGPGEALALEARWPTCVLK